MGPLLRCAQAIDDMSAWLGRLAGWVGLMLMAVTLIQVISRYLFNVSWVAVQELEWHLFGAMFLLAAGYTLNAEGHVRVDIFYARFSRRGQALVNMLGVLLLLLPICGIVVYFGCSFTAQAWDFTNSRPPGYYSVVLGGPGDLFYEVSLAVESLLRRTVFIGEISPDPGGLEARWLVKALVPLGFFFLGLQGLSMGIKSLAVVCGVDQDR
jgi:TRAP-type mannitol/chloroaromatic compound transport system permease small subunit